MYLFSALVFLVFLSSMCIVNKSWFFNSHITKASIRLARVNNRVAFSFICSSELPSSGVVQTDEQKPTFSFFGQKRKEQQIFEKGLFSSYWNQ